MADLSQTLYDALSEQAQRVVKRSLEMTPHDTVDVHAWGQKNPVRTYHPGGFVDDCKTHPRNWDAYKAARAHHEAAYKAARAHHYARQEKLRKVWDTVDRAPSQVVSINPADPTTFVVYPPRAGKAGMAVGQAMGQWMSAWRWWASFGRGVIVGAIIFLIVLAILHSVA